MGEDEKPEIDGSADTQARDPSRSPSQQELHDDVKAALFRGSKKRETYESGVVLAGRYRIAGLIGRGGMGEVYRAQDLELGEDVAIKFLPRAYARDPGLRRRFVNEVKVARQITHPSVCRVHDIGEADGRHFLSMELIDGEDLSSLLRRIGRLPQEKALELAQQLCSGLAALHARGVLHRDLKPSNVMIDGEGRLKLADFGLAAMEGELRPEELRDGTPAYMAPEQAAGKEVTAKSDIFALGLVLYELIAGRHAFATGTDATGKPTIDRGSTPVSIASRVRGLPPELDDVIRACIDPDPAGRPSSVIAIAASLPGGDPLAAALAAGRAPSVEAVAGARVVGTLPAWLAYALAAFVALATIGFAAIEPVTSVLGRYQQELSVELLTHRAREVLEATGNAPERDDSIGRFEIDRRYLSALHDGTVADDSQSPVLFVYRQATSNLSAFGNEVTVDDPPLVDRGGARVTLDGAGRLRTFTIVPPARTGDAAPCDFEPLFRLAGLDPDALVEIDPVITPRVFADERRAWRGTIEATGIEVTAEAAALGGSPVWMSVRPPWNPPADNDAEPVSADGPPAWLEYLVPVVLIGFTGIVFMLSRRSIKRGDADVTGAFRAAVFVALLTAFSEFFGGHHSGPWGAVQLFYWMLRNSIFLGGFAFLCYVIVEPYARRYLPGAMVGWTRLIRGHWRDPLVARDVLIGAVVALLFLAASGVRAWILDDPRQVLEQFGPVYGARHALSILAFSTWVSVIGILQLFVLYVVVVVVARGRGRAAMVVFFVLWVIIEFPKIGLPDDTVALLGVLAITMLDAAMLVVLITRFGLLAAAAMQLTVHVLLQFPITLAFDAWYAPYGAIAFVAIGALALFGLRCARARPVV